MQTSYRDCSFHYTLQVLKYTYHQKKLLVWFHKWYIAFKLICTSIYNLTHLVQNRKCKTNCMNIIFTFILISISDKPQSDSTWNWKAKSMIFYIYLSNITVCFCFKLYQFNPCIYNLLKKKFLLNVSSQFVFYTFNTSLSLLGKIFMKKN